MEKKQTMADTVDVLPPLTPEEFRFIREQATLTLPALAEKLNCSDEKLRIIEKHSKTLNVKPGNVAALKSVLTTELWLSCLNELKLRKERSAEQIKRDLNTVYVPEIGIEFETEQDRIRFLKFAKKYTTKRQYKTAPRAGVISYFPPEYYEKRRKK
ncbi:MAG: hypothetical protein NT007_09850 [Candidatus Kapabacteria bacterium]|nr:hypothetical protein [Candidatus Kapabacteria bacterium]